MIVQQQSPRVYVTCWTLTSVVLPKQQRLPDFHCDENLFELQAFGGEVQAVRTSYALHSCRYHHEGKLTQRVFASVQC